jgi:hypothetical protein
MRTWRRSVGFVLAALVGLSTVQSARAQLLVVATPGDPPAIAHAELAYAAGAGTPVTWLSLRVTRGPVALVAALPPDAVADAGLDAWFMALEVTASPNVILPRSRTNCGQAGSFVHVAWPRAGGVTAAELTVQTADDVATALEEQGLTLEAELPPAERYLIWSWPAADAPQTTRTLRIAGGAAPLTLLPGSPFPVLVSSVTRGSAALPAELFNRELPVTFVANQRPASDYIERLQDWLVARTEPLLETRARGPLFDWGIFDDSISLASLVSSYAVRAAKEVPGLDADTCAEQLRALRDPDAPSAAACSEAADAGLALAAAGPELATLQRFVVSGVTGFAAADATPGGMPSPPVLRAQLLDDSACDVQDQPPLMVPATGAPVSNNPGPRGTTTVVVEETVVIDESGPTEVSCGSSPQTERQDEYAGSNDSCSSDTSSSSESDSSSCSGDSSSSSDSSDSGCSSSSSSSDSSDTSCDGGSDESSSYDGDTCTGAAAPGGERTEKAQAGLSFRASVRRPQRLKTSLWSLAFAAVILPIRRRKREGERQRLKAAARPCNVGGLRCKSARASDVSGSCRSSF